MDMKQAIEEGVRRLPGPPEDRTQKALAARIEAVSGRTLSPQALSKWTKVPAARVLAFCEVTGMTPHEVRPDIYPAAYGQTGQNNNHAAA